MSTVMFCLKDQGEADHERDDDDRPRYAVTTAAAELGADDRDDLDAFLAQAACL
jgi:hypothetical protein